MTTGRRWDLHVGEGWALLCTTWTYCEECFERVHNGPSNRVPVIDAAYHDARVRELEAQRDENERKGLSLCQQNGELLMKVHELEAVLERVRKLAEGYEHWAEMHGNETYRVFAFDIRRALSATEGEKRP